MPGLRLAVRKIIGIPAVSAWDCSRSATVKPLPPGNEMSRIARSGFDCTAVVMAVIASGLVATLFPARS